MLPPEAQRQRIRAYCELKGLHLAEIFEDPGVSGGKALSSRPAGTELLAIARKSKPVIVVAKFDRLFRSVADAAQMIVWLDYLSIELMTIASDFEMTNPPILVNVSRHESAKRPCFWRPDEKLPRRSSRTAQEPRTSLQEASALDNRLLRHVSLVGV